MTERRGNSLLRWAGSKRKLLPRLREYWPLDAERYVEPFVGSGALFFDLAPGKAVLADINEELIHAYRVIAKSPLEVYQAASRRPSKSHYLALRKADPASLNDVERASRFLYLNRYCFNGLYRTSLEGRFNVPYAPRRSGSLPAWADFQVAAAQLQRATLLHMDFESLLLRHARPHDFVYLDPPYAVANQRIFRQYGPQTFGLDDIERLSSVLFALDAVGSKFLLSYADCPEARKAFRGWRTERVQVHRNISGFGMHRRSAAELLVSNMAPTRGA